MNLYYLPVERYKNRWTEYVSGSCGMFSRAVLDLKRNIAVTALVPDEMLREIRQGAVLDVYERTKYAFWQVQELLHLIEIGRIDSRDVIYIEDFWHPGFEMIPYACHIAGIKPSVYAFCHAQSVDPNDFTHPMWHWMRPMEIGWANWLTGIFVAAKELKQMLVENAVAPPRKVHVTGTVMRRQTLIDFDWIDDVKGARLPIVVFASRPDPEKCPEFFFSVAEKLQDSDIEFLYLSGRELPESICKAAEKAGVGVLDNISKREYFQHLQTASLAFNCAKQDFVGYCQLDALAAGCPVLCPNYLTFPDLMRHDGRYLYKAGDINDACDHIRAIVSTTAGTPAGRKEVPGLYSRFGDHYEHSVRRMMKIMYPE